MEIYIVQEHALIAVTIPALLSLIQQVAPKLAAHHTYVRYLPFYPVVLAVVAMFVPGLGPEAATIANRVATGIVIGSFLGWGHKAYSQTALGQDTRIQLRGGDP